MTRLLLVLLIALEGVGCSSGLTRGRDLPDQWRAVPGAGRQQVRLTGLAGQGGAAAAIAPADVLAVQVLTGLEEEPDEPMLLRVDAQGDVDVPIVGRVAVAGVEPEEASRRIASAGVERAVYVRPQVNVRFEERASHSVTVLGAVNEPGTKQVPRSTCDLLTAIAAAGGFTEDAGAVVEVLRHDRAVSPSFAAVDGDKAVRQVAFHGPGSGVGQPAERIDLSDPATRPGALHPLGDRDVVIVRPREKRVVHVSGLVAEPDQFELPEDHDLRVLDAIAMAGGTTTSVADKVIVIRQVADVESPLVVQVSIAEAKRNGSENLRLQSGDLISVESTVATTVAETFNSLFRITMGVGGDLTLF
ncbi:SLBB domain-containing protein [Botrimarina sp.]|uniref:SLBB domain-containing protein n=1 Tax=Botrimarina sp. TaxID=2795802 RepID=UPI0032ED2518